MKENAKFQFHTFQSKGEYDYVQMEFDAILEGDVKANKIQCNGAAKIRGDIQSLELILNGVTDIKGNCKCGNVEIHGESKIDGTIRAREFILNGTLTEPEKMKIDKFVLKNGSLNVEQYLQGNDISGRGGINTKELRGDSINLELSKKSSIATIIGKDISVKAGSSRLLGKILSSKTMIIERVEGESIYLENIIAEYVKGNKVVLGKGCKINKIEFKESLENNLGSIVTENIKL